MNVMDCWAPLLSVMKIWPLPVHKHNLSQEIYTVDRNNTWCYVSFFFDDGTRQELFKTLRHPNLKAYPYILFNIIHRKNMMHKSTYCACNTFSRH